MSDHTETGTIDDPLAAAKVAIKDAGYDWFALGREYSNAWGVRRYWLNARPFVDANGQRWQPAGWFTAEQLEALEPWQPRQNGSSREDAS